MWQDYIFTIGSVFFAVGLVPSILGKHKPSLWTSFVTGFWLSVFAGVYVTLDLTFAAVSTGVTALMWWTLFIQKTICTCFVDTSSFRGRFHDSFCPRHGEPTDVRS